MPWIISYTATRINANETLNLVVGASEEPSSVEKDGQVLLTAAAGQNNDGWNGGDGYSGGGAGDNNYRGENGGSNGSDGGSYDSAMGGKGSGLDIGTLNITRFILSPGKAGTAGGNSVYNAAGGGGGGILVNGEKPGGGSEHSGEGFGGGGGYYYGGFPGFPGCVLIEV